MDRARQEFETAGARLVLIGQASDRQAQHFRRRHDIDVPVLADAERESYRAAGAKVGTASELLGPKVVAKGALATLRSRKMQSRPIGDPAQLGGTMVVRPDGEVAWSHMSQDASDNASVQEILAALRT